jgi:glycerol-3-phosphate dehydrogenase (NAD(P)+)
VKFAVLGNGGFGTAMAIAAWRMRHVVALFGHDVAYTAQLAQTRQNPRYLPGVSLPDEVLVSSDARAVLAGAGAVLVAVPTQHVRATVAPMRESLPAGVPLISLSKGLEQTTTLRPSQVLADVAPGHPVLALSGPSHAEEVARGMPALVVLAGATPEWRRELQAALSDQHLRVYRNDDLLGVELCGALKNVMAVASGIAEGLGLGDNARAAILARGLAEMRRYGEAEGARAETFFGIAGVGDLAATAFSAHGRNRALGERIGRGETLTSILASTQKVAEGVFTARVVQRRAFELRIEMPLCDAVCRVLFDGLAPAIAVRELMERDRKRERD